MAIVTYHIVRMSAIKPSINFFINFYFKIISFHKVKTNFVVFAMTNDNMPVPVNETVLYSRLNLQKERKS